MDLRSSREAASRSLSQASYDPKKLAVVHIGAVTLVSLVLALVNYLLSLGLSSTAGLSGIGLRSALGTVQYILSAGSSLLLPFWEIGFLFAALKMARGESAEPRSLLEGFRRFAPVLRLFFLEMLIYTGLAIAAVQIASTIFVITPLSAEMQEVIQSHAGLLSSGQSLELSEELIATITPHMIPVYVIFLILFAIVAIPLFYRLRLARFAVMDDAPRARIALAVSTRATKGHRWSLFLVDLSFWWFYAAQIGIAALSYAVELLTLLGISLPVNKDVAVLVCYLVSLALQFLLFRQFGSYVHTTYAHCYDRLRASAPQPPAAPSDPIPRA